MRDQDTFKETGDVIADVNRLQARAVMRLGKARGKTDRHQDMIVDAIEYLKLAGELMREWEDRRLDEQADSLALGEMVERHVERILGDKLASETQREGGGV